MKARGFTLLELMISMVLGLFLLAGILSTLVMSRSTTEDSFSQGELQENGRLAMRLLTQDLKWAGFWGDYTGLIMQEDEGVTLSSGASIAAGDDCLDERDQGSLPDTTDVLRPVWGARVSGSGAAAGLDCLDGAPLVPNSDILSIKRLLGPPVADASPLDNNRFYMATNTEAALIFPGTDTRPTTSAMANRQVWEYQHRLYYLTTDNNLPQLRMRMLTVGGGSWLVSGPMVEGIEQVSILYGIDDSTPKDGQIERYVSAGSVTALEWGQGRIIAAKVYVLVRALRESAQYVNNNVYQVGDISVSGGGDGYRRLLLESSVEIRNPAMVAGG